MIDLYLPVFRFALREDLQDDKRFLPTRAEPTASGWDVRAAMPNRKPLVIKPLEQAKISLGFRGFCPPGWWYELKPRSSSFAKKSLHALYGTIDETYEGELVFACQYIPPFHHYGMGSIDEEDVKRYFNSNQLTIEFGDAIGQIIPIRREEMEVHEIPNSDYDILCKQRDAVRGAGGFGSTGK